MTTTLVKYWGRTIMSARWAGHFAQIFRRTACLGWRTYLVCAPPAPDEPWVAPLLDTGVTIEYIPRPRRNFCQDTIRRAHELCQRVQADVFHCDNIHTSPMIGAALAGVPARLWFKRSMQPAYEEMRAPSLRDKIAVSVRFTSLLATRIVTVSEAVKGELVQLGIPAAKIVVFPTPLDRKTIRLEDRYQARTTLGYLDSDIVITTVGHAVPVKGWDTLVRAFADLSKDVPQTRLLMIGSVTSEHEQPFFGELTHFLEEHGLMERVRFTGHLEDPWPAFVATDIYTMPSRSEGNSNALNEGFGAGLACIATKVGNAPMLIQDGVNGLLVERDNPRALADSLRRLAQDPELRRRLREATRAPVDAPTTEDYVDRLVELYDLMLRARPE